MPKIRLPYFNKTGFTLIELLVVVAISSIVVGGAIAGFVRFANVQEVVTATQEVRDLFVSAKAKAQVRETPSTNCDTLLGYQVITEASKVSIRPFCEVGVNVTLGGVAANYPSVGLPSGLTLNTSADYRYYTLEGGATYANGNPISGDEDIIIVSNGSGISYQFTVTNGGAISNVEKTP